MKKLLTCLFVLPIALSAAAQDDDPFAAFDELEADAAVEAAKEETGVLGKLGENFSGTARMQYTLYPQEHTPVGPPTAPSGSADGQDHFFNTSLDMETWTAGDDWRVDAAAFLQYGHQKKAYQGTGFDGRNVLVDRDYIKHRYFFLNELYLTRNFSDWDLTVGKKIMDNGIAPLYSPANNFTPVAGIDPIDAKEIGIWQTRADLYKGDYTWSIAALPVWQPEKGPNNRSRWINTAPGAQPTAYPNIEFENVGWFGKVKTTQSGWDLFASLYKGPGRNYVIRNAAIPYREVPKIISPAVGYSTTHDAWEIHGEAVYSTAYHGNDEDYFAFVQGTTYTMDGDNVKKIGLESIEWTVDGAWEVPVGDQTKPGYNSDSSDARIGRKDIMTRIRFKVSEDLDFEYNNHTQFTTWGYLNRISGSWELMTGLTWKTAVEFFGGNGGGGAANLSALSVNYGGWTQNNRIMTSLEYEF